MDTAQYRPAFDWQHAWELKAADFRAHEPPPALGEEWARYLKIRAAQRAAYCDRRARFAGTLKKWRNPVMDAVDGWVRAVAR